jgi:hypothetical protein
LRSLITVPYSRYQPAAASGNRKAHGKPCRPLRYGSAAFPARPALTGLLAYWLTGLLAYWGTRWTVPRSPVLRTHFAWACAAYECRESGPATMSGQMPPGAGDRLMHSSVTHGAHPRPRWQRAERLAGSGSGREWRGPLGWRQSITGTVSAIDAYGGVFKRHTTLVAAHYNTCRMAARAK